MSRISSMFDIGKRSMANSQTALQTVGHNIANANTEGYSRQRVDIVTNEPLTVGSTRIGMGARAGTIQRTVNQYLDKQVAEETSKLGTAVGMEENMGRVENIFNEQTNKGLNRFMGNFFNSFRELANNPESQATRAAVKESTKAVTKDFARINSGLKDIQKDIDNQVKVEVAEVNMMTKEVASLNEKVSHVEMQGLHANDERDRRDLLIKKLGEKLNIHATENKEGQVNITAGNTGLLVSGFTSYDLDAVETPGREDKREANVDILYRNSKDGTPFTMTRQITGGKLGGALEVRDKVINGLLDDVDSLAYSLHESVNTVHAAGYNRYGQTNVAFFKPLEDVRNASEALQINDAIDADAGLIAAGYEANAPADNRIANTIAGLQLQPLLKDGTTTIDDYFNGVVGEFAVAKRQTNMVHDQQKAAVKQLENLRESISGVSLDEEAAKMIEFQKSFEASARLIRVADEMLETVMQLKKL